MKNYRSPDWRYRECLECLEEGKNLYGDRTAKWLFHFLKEKSHLPKCRIDSKYGWVKEAYHIWNDVQPTSDRWLLEAYALTDMTDKEIAEELMLEEKLVETYLDCFFDVRDSFRKKRYIRGLRNYFCAYEHALLYHIGYKYIMAFQGRDAFERMITHRMSMTSDDSTFFRVEGRNNRGVKVWSKSWETVNAHAILNKEDAIMLDSLMNADRQDQAAETKAKENTLVPNSVDIVLSALQEARTRMLNTLDKNLSPVEERLITIN